MMSIVRRLHEFFAPPTVCKTYTELAKKVCPRLRDSACWRSGEITQPRTNVLANSVLFVRKFEVLLCSDVKYGRPLEKLKSIFPPFPSLTSSSSSFTSNFDCILDSGRHSRRTDGRAKLGKFDGIFALPLSLCTRFLRSAADE